MLPSKKMECGTSLKKVKEFASIPININDEIGDKVDEPLAEPILGSPLQIYPRSKHLPPSYLQYYEVRRDDDPDEWEEEIIYYALFVDCDPMTYEGATNEDC